MFKLHLKTKPHTVVLAGSDFLTSEQSRVTEWQQPHSASNMSQILAQAINPGESQLDTILIRHLQKTGQTLVDTEPLRSFPFNYDTPVSGTLWHHGAEYHFAVKGSPEYILNRCDLSDSERESITLQLRSMAQSGDSVIAVATGISSRTLRNIIELKPSERLSFTGLIAVTSEIAPTARQLISTAQQRGIALYLTSAKHPTSLRQLAHELRLIQSDADIYDLDHLEVVHASDITPLLTTVRVFANSNPSQNKTVHAAIHTMDPSSKVVHNLEELTAVLAN